MELEAYRRYPHQASYDYPVECPGASHASQGGNVGRQDPRLYPMGAPGQGPRGRGVTREEETPPASRRRISVACGRCRRRKIRCSGDPGDGSGCFNCRSAGVDPAYCLFHRVGSTEALDALEKHCEKNCMHASTFPNNPYLNLTPMVPTCVSMPIHSRPISQPHYPQIVTSQPFQPTWTIPYSEDTSPIEAYNQDTAGIFMPSTQMISNVYDQGYRWHQDNHRAAQNLRCLEHDSGSSSMSDGMTQISAPPVLIAAPVDPLSPLSPLNMTSIESALPLTLPKRPHPPQNQMQILDTSAPQRRLPIPQPSSTPASRNIVDQMQDQRLRASSISTNDATTKTSLYRKLPLWPAVGTQSDVKVTLSQNSQSLSEEVLMPTTVPVSVPIAEETTVAVAPDVKPTIQDSSTTLSQAPTSGVSFTTAPLLEMLPVSMPSTTYSNFRNCPSTTGPTSDLSTSFGRNSSDNAPYSLGASGKRHSTGTLSSETGMSRYIPLNAIGPYHPSEYRKRNATKNRSSMSKVNPAH
ncbi:hypothetical protein BU24DRAFT_449210 [Aaosphaeria arxii CBS 175.79]|uniref:Zn(2)-C6 fungal-type domain-containing protein n=1 Tax=Aaosphaeria arxii CBS 175.79 TaxID=1450172 RepID=A0A6A5XW63_9PLEO|nr:uncharacterized protein BU24DRAFT_449210 [Aaosphaeria arxii CBS 175.79]KAF2017558.1 hypothetical protein BU24DRAFT_449210 [Aaosphaeria arxii CBS 175.79]